MREGRLQGPSIDGGRCHGGNEGCGGSPGRGRPSLLLSGTDGLKAVERVAHVRDIMLLLLLCVFYSSTTVHPRYTMVGK